MNNRRLARKARRQARRARRRGEMTTYEYDSVMLACQDEEVLTRWNAEIQKINPWNEGLLKADMGWGGFLQNAWDWFVANWDEILRILLIYL
jgi:hypothetical protein